MPRALSAEDFKTQSGAFTKAVNDAVTAAGYPAKADRAQINYPMVIGILTILVLYVTDGLWPNRRAAGGTLPHPHPLLRHEPAYHIGNGWFGGFLPTFAFAMVAATGDVLLRLWYPIVVALGTFVIGLIFLPETRTGTSSRTADRLASLRTTARPGGDSGALSRLSHFWMVVRLEAATLAPCRPLHNPARGGRQRVMGKTRLEAFSDGVIAIIITIMVLELKVPHDTSPHALATLWPIFSAMCSASPMLRDLLAQPPSPAPYLEAGDRRTLWATRICCSGCR